MGRECFDHTVLSGCMQTKNAACTALSTPSLTCLRISPGYIPITSPQVPVEIRALHQLVGEGWGCTVNGQIRSHERVWDDEPFESDAEIVAHVLENLQVGLKFELPKTVKNKDWTGIWTVTDIFMDSAEISRTNEDGTTTCRCT